MYQPEHSIGRDEDAGDVGNAEALTEQHFYLGNSAQARMRLSVGHPDSTRRWMTPLAPTEVAETVTSQQMPMRKKAFAAIASLLLLTAVSSGVRGPQSVQTLKAGTLRIGTYFVNPPFEYVSQGKRVGFEVDLMNEVAHRLGLRPLFVNTRWESIMQQMQDDRFDCIVGGITITPARQQTLIWSVPYMTTTLSLIINGARTPQIHGISDMKEASVGVQAATTDYDAAMAMRTQGKIGTVRVYPFDRIGDAINDLIAGRITAVMKVYPVAAWLARQNSDLRIVAEVPNDLQPLGIGFSKSNAGLAAAVDGALASMKRDGTYERLAHKWGVP